MHTFVQSETWGFVLCICTALRKDVPTDCACLIPYLSSRLHIPYYLD